MNEPQPDRVAAEDTPDPLVLADYRPGHDAVLTDSQRWPTAGRADLDRLRRWRTHPDAPVWTHATGDRLTAEQVVRVRRPLPTAGWLAQHLAAARRTPRYRDREDLRDLADFPTIRRRDLAADIAAFVPMDADLDRMVHGTSSGSTGAALAIPDDVEEVARMFHLVRDLASRAGASVVEGGERMVLANLVHQRQAYTYASLVSSFSRRAMARINLHPGGWPGPGCRARFLADADPQILSGHPTSLAELLAADLAAVLHPAVIVSGAMELSSPLRRRLQETFGCPVLDIYGLHETRPIGWRTDGGPFRILNRRLHVEILESGPGARDVAVRDGEVGEITVTAGENPLLPLVRYRTGDFGRLVRLDGAPGDAAWGIADLQGREHVILRGRGGAPVPSVDLTQQLQAHGALGWTVEQGAGGTVRARIVGGDADRIRAALVALLGDDVTVEQVGAMADLGEGKPRRFRSEVPDAHGPAGATPDA